MLIRFFLLLRDYQIPVTVKELLDLIGVIEKGVLWCDQREFYHLARTCLVKDERYYDRYDLACQVFFDGMDKHAFDVSEKQIPQEWLSRQMEKYLDEASRQKLKRHKDLQDLMQTLAKRLQEQKARHQGGNRMVGTGGTSPFGAYGDHPEGVRIGGIARRRSAVKIWDDRRFKDLDAHQQLDTRGFKVALKALRQWARQGPEDQLDLEQTLNSTARQGGWLDLVWRAQRHNAVKVLIFFDVGGSMDPYVHLSERLFAAARSEFKHIRFFYFHNMIYESVWPSANRRDQETVPVMELIRTFSNDYRVIFVGDAAMAPSELLAKGGSLEHWNQEPGKVWLTRLLSYFTKSAWLNPHPKEQWPWFETIAMTQSIMESRMYPLSVSGIQAAVRALQ